QGNTAMKNSIIVGRAWAAFDTLHRWDVATDKQAVEAQAIQFDQHCGGRVRFGERVDYTAEIHNLASEVLMQHQYYVTKGQSAELNADAIAAWKLVIRTRDRAEIEKRLRIAITASARVVERCALILCQKA